MEKGFKVLQVVPANELFTGIDNSKEKMVTPSDKDGKQPAVERQKIPMASAKDKGKRLPQK